ncbi:hypothetical protein PUN28_012947 [Cardiocondyla obscurior]|uniref:Uncharacterized protein n=1 Tax=Cardiocondyla obscurior TaxID=286306 RepID=A0AAW2FA42_9HYME
MTRNWRCELTADPRGDRELVTRCVIGHVCRTQHSFLHSHAPSSSSLKYDSPYLLGIILITV